VARGGAWGGALPEGKKKEIMEEMIEYETPWAQVRGVFLCENIATIQSPVKSVTLEDWEPGDAQTEGDGEISLPLW
jgi:hypothetical protein